jgi:tRNA nucleotidyltransferase (CCA-adding enzyme)
VEGREDIRKIVSRKTSSAARGGRRRAARPPGHRPRAARERLARLASEPDLAELARVAASHDARAWIVGGALRDLLLGRDPPEVDVAVTGDGGAIAREMESRGQGRAILLSGERRPRVFRIAGRSRTMDVAEVEGGSIETDLARRDFTVNAMAAELPSLALLDPFGGIFDLSQRRLRMVSENNLADDPLRALRGARLFATHGLVPDRETSRACRRVAAALARVAPERVQSELAKLLEAPHAAAALSWSAVNGLLEPAFRPGAADHEWRKIARASAALDQMDRDRLDPTRRRRLRLAVLAARLGFSPREAASWLRRLRWGSREAEEVSRLLDLADAASRAGRGNDVWRWLLDAGDRARDSLRLLEILRPRSRHLVRRLRGLVAKRRPLPDVRGADVLQWLGVPPGPEVGRLLDTIRAEAIAGRIRTREDARKWLRAHVRTQN